MGKNKWNKEQGQKKWQGQKTWSQNKWQKQGSKAKWRDESGGVLGKFEGVIQRKEKTHKYAFIVSPELQSSGHGICYVYYDQLKNMQDGKVVTFTAYLTKDNKCQAKDLRSSKQDGGPDLGEFKGTIASKGGKFGFIKCDQLKKEYKEDVFVLWDELKQFKQ